jgi:hypothetical protein
MLAGAAVQRLKFPLLVFFATLSASCAEQKNKEQLSSIQQEVSRLEDRIGKLELENMLLKAKNRAFLQKSDDGYSNVLTNFGPMTIQLDNIRKEGSGARVFVTIGNPSAFLINEFELSGAWGPVDKDGNVTEESHEFNSVIRSALQGNTWNKVSFIVNGANPDAMGFVRVNNIEVKRIYMNTE